jgi:hypothetical protein
MEKNMIEPQYFVLTVVIPIEDNFDTIIRLLKFSSYEKEYQPSMNSIHKMQYRFGPLTEEGVDNFKEAFRDIFKNSPFKNHCSFTVSEIPQ